jgi:hypothetical protein
MASESWVCGRAITPGEPRRPVQIPATRPAYPRAFVPVPACMDGGAEVDLDRICPEPGATTPLAAREVRLLVLPIPSWGGRRQAGSRSSTRDSRRSTPKGLGTQGAGSA